MSAHHAFGARTGRAPALIGTVLVVVALVAGGGLAVVLAAFPLPVLAALLLVAAVAHVRLLRDVRGVGSWALVVGVGVVGGFVHLGAAVVGGLVAYAVLALLHRRRAVPTR